MTARSMPVQDSSRRYLPLLLLLFVGSGCAALIYEVVWFQLLQLVIGSSAVSLGVLLGTFMGGMCLGSLAAAALIVARTQHPLRVYALLELGIGVDRPARCCSACRSSAASTRRGPASASSGILLRGVVAGICLLPPTLLMGATLPAIARWVETTPEGVSWLGFFYGGNIAGAVHRQPARRLLPAARVRHGDRDLRRRRAERRRRASSALAARDGDAVRAGRRRRDAGRRRAPRRAARLRRDRAVGHDRARRRGDLDAPAVAAFGATVYTFSLILAVFLVGLGIGSSVGVGDRAQTSTRPRVALGWCQMLLCARDGVGGLHADASRCRTGRSTRRSRPTRGSTSSSISCAASGPCCPARFCGARASRWRWRRSPSRGQDPGAAGRRRLRRQHRRRDRRLARQRACVLVVWLGSQHAQQVLIVHVRAVGADAARAGGRGRQPARARSQWGADDRCWSSRRAAPGCSRAACRRCPACSSPTAATRRRGSGQSNIIYIGEGLNASVAVSRAVERRAQLPQRRQGAGVERAAGHAPAAHARPPDAR